MNHKKERDFKITLFFYAMNYLALLLAGAMGEMQVLCGYFTLKNRVFIPFANAESFCNLVETFQTLKISFMKIIKISCLSLMLFLYAFCVESCKNFDCKLTAEDSSKIFQAIANSGQRATIACRLTEKDSADIYFAILDKQKSDTGAQQYLFLHKTSDLRDKAAGGSRISKEDAIAMVSNFRTENEHKIWYPLKTADKQNLCGFYVKGEIFDTLITKNKCNGIRFYLAKHNDAGKRTYTMVLVGTKKAAANAQFKDSNGNDDDPDSGIFENIDPCPNNCGNLTITTPMLLKKK